MELLQIITFRRNKNNSYLHFGKATEEKSSERWHPQ